MLEFIKFLFKLPFAIMGLIYTIFTTWWIALIVFGIIAILLSIFWCKTNPGRIIVWAIAIILVILIAI